MDQGHVSDAGTAAVGPVTFLETPGDQRRRERAVIGLLIAITGLLAVLVVGLGLGAFWLTQQAAALRQETGSLRQDLSQALATSQALTRDLLERQAGLSQALGNQAEQLASAQTQLDARRNRFGAIPAGPFEKADYAINVSLVGIDEARMINRHLAETQAALARHMALTPAQQALLADTRRALQAGPPHR